MKAEDYLKEKIKKNPQDPMNYYYLAKELMRKPLKDTGSLKEYLVKCISKNTKPAGGHEHSKRDSLYLFENNVREFIRFLLEANYGENWWREGVPKKVRAKCASRKEEG